MKKIILITSLSFVFTSCYLSTCVVGEGAQKGVTEIAKQHNFIYGLAPGKTPNTKEMAKGEENYEISIEHTFIDGLIQNLTFGIYCPTTIKVRR